MTEEKFEFTAAIKKKIGFIALLGFLSVVLGAILFDPSAGHHGDAAGHGTTQIEAEHHGDAEAGHGASDDGHHGTSPLLKRIFVDFWINNVFFTGLAIIGVFFFAVQYVAQAGWSAPIKRIPLAMGSWLPIAAILMLGTFFVANHDIFHWTHDYLYHETLEDGSPNPEYDEIIAGKQGYLNLPFYLARMIVFFGVWYIFFRILRKNALAEDLNGGEDYWRKMVKISAGFIVFFAVSSSMSAWDWVMSIDTHWFSTMMGWYVFASWWVSGLAVITLITATLKENGYLKIVNANHLHDLGKFVWGFSIFWTYIWFSQFLLIYYANIPEESIYFVERWQNDHYAPYFFINLIINFFFPFLLLMTRDAKRHAIFLKIVCSAIVFGHWLDFYLMITPGTLKENGGFGFLEIGLMVIYGCAFLFVALQRLAKSSLVAKNHPMLEESMHHHI
ncbi:quinol:cytochrome C oxidoreductase [Fulvivirgaceae bacterium BMA10]|uniref:Quinol:cytochrome C oxidoreductase n=1 Tax=Splendidivirga corallicola TaxID=3051826 RepID=A0ABT8KQY7_9BACT|nr:quinol:cytochrome C oxidoreductase [Fulvivirgaceae bacterium BMA10]